MTFEQAVEHRRLRCARHGCATDHDFEDRAASCAIGRWGPIARGLGDIVEILAKPIALALKMDCYDKAGELKAGTPCSKRKRKLNRTKIPFLQ